MPASQDDDKARLGATKTTFEQLRRWETPHVPRSTRKGLKEWNHRVGLTGSLALPNAELPLHPYILGAWLGDGTSANASLTVGPQDLALADHIREMASELGSPITATRPRLA